MACCILQMGPSARVIDANVKQKRPILASRVFVRREPPDLCCYVHTLRVQPAVSSASSLSEEPCISNNNLDFVLAKESSQYLVESPNIVERAPSRFCTRYGVKAGGFLPEIIVIIHPNKFRLVMRPQAPA